MTKTIIAAVALLLTLSACGSAVDDKKAGKECLDAGGNVTRIAGKAVCERNGETIAEWRYYE
jgi:protein involved in sex pheromone biosynthesis